MATQDERLSVVEQSVTILRSDLLQVIADNSRSMSSLNRVVVQQEQNLRDVYHEITILTGVVGAQERDIKEMKEDLATVKEDLRSMGESVNNRFDRIDQEMKQGFSEIKLMLSQLTSGSQQET